MKPSNVTARFLKDFYDILYDFKRYDDLDEETRDNIDMGLISEEDAIKAVGGTMAGNRITEYRVQSLARNSAKGSEATVYTEEDLKKLPVVSNEEDEDVDLFDEDEDDGI